MPKVSVIVPIYNVEKYIEKCLDSLVNQTLKDIEIILVNDGSLDNSEQIVKKYLDKYNYKIKYLIKENGGLSDARNYGIKYATGEYVAFLDSDDYVDNTIYEKMYQTAIRENCDFVECDFVWKYPKKNIMDNGVVYKNKYEMLENARVVAWNKLIKRELLENANIEFPKGLRYEDIEFFYKLIPYIRHVGFVKENLIYYVQRNNSIINTQNENTKDIFIVLENVINFYKQKGFYEEYKNSLEYAYVRILLCSSFMRILKIKDRNIRNRLIKLTWDKLNVNFPEWKKNEVLRNVKTKKNIYLLSVNKITIKIYAFLFRIKPML